MTSPDANARKLRSFAEPSSVSTCDRIRFTVENAIMPKTNVTEYASASLITTSTSQSLYLRIDTANASGISASGRIAIVVYSGFT